LRDCRQTLWKNKKLLLVLPKCCKHKTPGSNRQRGRVMEVDRDIAEDPQALVSQLMSQLMTRSTRALNSTAGSGGPHRGPQLPKPSASSFPSRFPPPELSSPFPFPGARRRLNGQFDASPAVEAEEVWPAPSQPASSPATCRRARQHDIPTSLLRRSKRIRTPTLEVRNPKRTKRRGDRHPIAPTLTKAAAAATTALSLPRRSSRLRAVSLPLMRSVAGQRSKHKQEADNAKVSGQGKKRHRAPGHEDGGRGPQAMEARQGAGSKLRQSDNIRMTLRRRRHRPAPLAL